MKKLSKVIRDLLFGALFVLSSSEMMAQSHTYSYKWTADRGNGYYVNPLLNADFPDCDVIRVGDTFYFVSTTMYHFPGATLLKSKDLVNWEYCANPLKQIDSNNAYNLTGSHHYSQGQWAATLNYHNGKFYIYFICYGRSGVDNTQQVLLTATDPEGKWTMTKMDDHYYDAGWLFDDGENGDGYLYVACGINDIWVNKLSATTRRKLKSERVISKEGSGLEGCHMYHIGEYYYIYATYGGTEGSQTIFRSKNPMGPYEEHDGRVFEKQRIHQGALVDTPTGQWWTVLFKDAGAIGRIPYLEPVKWVDGWPVIGRNGRDVSENMRTYAKPKMSEEEQTDYTSGIRYLPTNDSFSSSELGLQWEWNHNPKATGWSLTERPGWMRLYSYSVTDNVVWARGSLTQRIIGNKPNGTTTWTDNYGTAKFDLSGMKEGDVAGLAVWQNPYSFIGVKMVDGKKKLFSQRCTFNSQNPAVAQELNGAELTSDTIYLRASTNFGTNACNYYYSYDAKSFTKWGVSMTMGYTLDFFVGQRYYLFNYSTKASGGHVDVDWFTTEKNCPADYFDECDSEALAVDAVYGKPEKVNSGCYDITGRKVNDPKKGFYILNGKKVIIQ